MATSITDVAVLLPLWMLATGSPVPGSMHSPNGPSQQASSASSATSPSASNSSTGATTSAQTQASNAPFESQMLAYGAVDQIVDQAVREVCARSSSDTNKITVVLYDQQAFAAIGQYKAFEASVGYLTKQYESLRDTIAPPVTAAGPGGTGSTSSTNPFIAVAPQIATLIQSSRQETPSSISLSNTAIALSTINKLKEGCAQKDTQPPNLKFKDIIYPPLYLSIQPPSPVRVFATLDDLFKFRSQVARHLDSIDDISKASAKDKQIAATYAQLEQSLSTILTTFLGTDPSSGSAGIISLSQGQEIAELLAPSGNASKVFVLYLSAITGGGTQRIYRNLFTNLFWGDIISYSGGAVISCALFEAAGLIENKNQNVPALKLLWADTLRYRTPTTKIASPSNNQGVESAKRGDNLNDSKYRD
jgi:hypothetical protein